MLCNNWIMSCGLLAAFTSEIPQWIFSGDGESRTVLDAFFLGKAVAEALNERIESAVGEFLSTVGRLQAEQQKQVQEFQVVSQSVCC